MPETLPLSSLPPEQQAAIAAQCTSAECSHAKAELQRARNQVLAHQEELLYQRERHTGIARAARAAWLLFLLLTALLLAALALPFSGIPIAYALTALAAAALVIAAALSMQTLDAHHAVENAQAGLRAARTRFDEAADAVPAHCSEYCWGDLSPPQSWGR